MAPPAAATAFEALAALNELGGLGTGVAPHPPPSPAQVSAVRHMAKYCVHVPEKMQQPESDQEAFQALLRVSLGYADEGGSGSRAVYRRGAVSLPLSRAGGVSLVELLPSDLREKLETGLGLLR